MFTGIVEETGIITEIQNGKIKIRGDVIFSDLKIGDSVAVNGICLTVTEISGRIFSTEATPETMKRTSLEKLSAGSKVNLERALASFGRFGGHIVTGHIDGTAKICEAKKDGNAVLMSFSCGENLMNYIIEKGSVAVDGISLTVASVSKDFFTVSVIPHTAKSTTLALKKVGDVVNIENDILGKYIERLVNRGKQSGCKFTEEYLKENGF